MKERPILFNAENVSAILDGRKTQTRRVIKPQPNPCRHKEIFKESEYGHDRSPEWRGQILDWVGYKYSGREHFFCYVCGNGLKFGRCPHCGKKGLYKFKHEEACRYCGINRLLIPGQDF